MPTVSVIIPAYNNADYLVDAVASLATQTYRDFDVLIINDGSTDTTAEVVSDLQSANPDMTIDYLEQDNSGQGTARNQGLQLVRGPYVMFLDSDDWLHPRALELSVKRIGRDKSDLAHFDYRYYYEDTGQFDYEVSEEFDPIDTYEGEDCSKLLLKRHYFTVTALFSRSFLLENNIRYGEGYFYEDFEFWTRIAVHATKISFIHSPLYNIRVNKRSTTRSNFDSDRHSVSFLKAAQASLGEVAGGSAYASFYLGAYLLKKLFLYYPNRIPGRHRTRLRHRFLDLLATGEYAVPPRARGSRVFQYLLSSGTIEKRRYLRFSLIIWYMTTVHPRVQRVAKAIRRTLGRYRRAARALTSQGPRKFLAQRSRENLYSASLQQPIHPQSILFLGFDHRFVGNSRYLFQEIMDSAKFADYRIQFATDDPGVPADIRVSPNSEDFFEAAATARTIILESWAPAFLQKREDSRWIQLWHGTPIKRLLFDSAEPDIMRISPRHRIKKYADIQRWDYMVADSPAGADKFQTSMLIPDDHLLTSGYPRVSWLLDHRDDRKLIDELRAQLEIPHGKRIVVYAPTWRDYNLKKPAAELSTRYLLDIEELAGRLGNQYVIIDKRHPYQQKNGTMSATSGENQATVISTPQLEMQELLLIADHLVSDYSSAIFDMIPLGKPFSLYVTDFAENQSARGVYEDIWDLVHPYQVSSLNAVIESLRNPTVVPMNSELAHRCSFAGKTTDLVSVIAD